MAATTYTLVPIPIWYFADKSGRPLGAGSMLTLRDQNRIETKAIYTDPAGTMPWPNPVLFNANGEAPGMFFWANDEPYFIVVYDKNGVQQFTISGYGPGIAGGGGGGTIVINTTLKNYVLNNVFWRNIGPTNGNFVALSNGQIVAPSNHDGFITPDITYIATGGAGSTDQVAFPLLTGDFTLGQVPLTGDVTPETYVEWECTSAGSETTKAFQFPIDTHVKNFEQQTMTAIIWAKGITPGINLTMNFIQFFGTSTGTAPASTPVTTTIPIGASPLSSGWAPYTATFTVPSVSGKTLGAGGDDGIYIQVGVPVGQIGHLYFTKPKLYLGTIGQVFEELQSYDEISAITDSPRTGDIKTSLDNFTPFGYVPMNDGTIGSVLSNGTTRSNVDTWLLYNKIWNGVSNTWAPVTTGRGATAIADFAANKSIALTKALGRVFAGTVNTQIAQTVTITSPPTALLAISSILGFVSGSPVQFTTTGTLPPELSLLTTYYVIPVDSTHISVSATVGGTAITVSTAGTGVITVTVPPYVLGQYLGEETHPLTINELPPHNHPGSTVQAKNPGGSGGSFVSGSADQNFNAPVQVASQGGVAGQVVPHNTLQPTTYMNVFIKL